MNAFRNLFKGRINRAQWLTGLAIIVAAFVAFGVLQTFLISAAGASALVLIAALGLVVELGALIAFISISVRRLHDTGRSGWWAISPVLLFLPFEKGAPNANAYGEPPHKRSVLATFFNLADRV